jgi:hypothetical protein
MIITIIITNSSSSSCSSNTVKNHRASKPKDLALIHVRSVVETWRCDRLSAKYEYFGVSLYVSSTCVPY